MELLDTGEQVLAFEEAQRQLPVRPRRSARNAAQLYREIVSTAKSS